MLALVATTFARSPYGLFRREEAAKGIILIDIISVLSMCRIS
jgi:hypothetical protein